MSLLLNTISKGPGALISVLLGSTLMVGLSAEGHSVCKLKLSFGNRDWKILFELIQFGNRKRIDRPKQVHRTRKGLFSLQKRIQAVAQFGLNAHPHFSSSAEIVFGKYRLEIHHRIITWQLQDLEISLLGPRSARFEPSLLARRSWNSISQHQHV